jgi:hypothetical protein
MRLRVRLVVAALAAALLLALPASAAAAIDIVSRGITPDPGVVNGTATIEVDVKVGAAPYIVEFFCCDAINTDTPKQSKVIDENSPETQGLSGRHKFTFNVGPAGRNSTDRVVLVRIADSTGQGTATKAFVFKDPTPPAPPPPPPDPGPTDLGQCPTSVSFGLILARTTGGGCWRKSQAPSAGYSSSGVKVDPRGVFYETSGRFVLNGIPFPAAPSGSSYLLAEPTSAAPGGQIGLDKTIELKLGPVTVFRQPLLWKLPTGSTEGKLAGFSMPTGTLGGLPIGGQIEVLFRKRAGRFATTFPISVTLPSIFRPSPGTVGSITGATEISTDDAGGVSIDGGKIQVSNAAIGKVALKDLCFSYLSANVSTRFAACEPPSLNGAPAVSCAPPTQSQERYDGALLIQLPTPSETEFAAYGGIAGGKFAYGGGFVDNAAIPLVAGITLERIGFGICLQPSLLLKGDAGLGFAKGLVRADVSLTYAEPTARTFFVEAAGFMSVATIPVGNGRVRVDSTGTVDFDLTAKMFLAGGLVELEGGIAGFIRPNPFAFNLDGRASVCVNTVIFGKPCARGTVIVSNLGAGGCADFGFIGQFGGFFFWKQPASGKRFDVGRGCGFQERVRVKRRMLRGGGADPVQTFPVPKDSAQYVAHFKGDGRPPKIKVTSPSGLTFSSSPTSSATTDNASFLIFENEDADETSVFLKKDAAPGDWKVEAILGTTITGVEFQGEEANPTVLAGSVTGSDTSRVLNLRYALRAGDTVSLDAIGKDFSQNIATQVRGAACPKGTTAPGRTPAVSRCAKLTWTPKFGYAGPRTVQATVLDKAGATVDRKAIATFKQGGPKTPPRVPGLRLVRKGRTVFAIWGAAGGNTTRYGAYAVLSDGRRIGHTSPRNCLAWKIDGVSPTTSVVLRLQAGRQDLQFGGAGSVTLKAKQVYAGPANLKKAPIPRPCASL